MIEYVKRDITTAEETIIVHGCNAQGKMASGAAKAIRAKWPEAYELYREEYKWFNNADSGFTLGHNSVCLSKDYKIIVSSITQEFYGRDPNVVYVSYPAIEKALYGVRMLAKFRGLTEFAMTKIGAGLGNGDWTRIEGIINKVFNDDYTVRVYVQ